jgi:hypothetical protein
MDESWLISMPLSSVIAAGKTSPNTGEDLVDTSKIDAAIIDLVLNAILRVL